MRRGIRVAYIQKTDIEIDKEGRQPEEKKDRQVHRQIGGRYQDS